MSLPNFFTVNDAIDEVEENEEPCDIYIMPPEDDGAVTENDSADEEHEGIHRLSGRQLLAEAEIDYPPAADLQLPIQAGVSTLSSLRWTTGELPQRSYRHLRCDLPLGDSNLANVQTPYEFWSLFLMKISSNISSLRQ